MGRVSKYKRVKSVDPFCRRKKDGSFGTGYMTGDVLWGTSMNRAKTDVKEKKRSKVALACKRRKLQRKGEENWRNVLKLQDEARWDVAPTEKDEFDLGDMVGSLRKEAIPTLDVDDDDGKTKANTCVVVTKRKSMSAVPVCSTPQQNNEKDSDPSDNPNSSLEQATSGDGKEMATTNLPMDAAAPLSARTSSTTTSKSVLRYHIPESSREEKKMNRLVWGSNSLLALQSSSKERREAAAAGKLDSSSARRQEGESMREYRARIRQETMHLIKKARREEHAEEAQLRRKPNKKTLQTDNDQDEERASRRERRKAFSQNRKKKTSTKTSSGSNPLWDDDDDDDDDDDAARFGEQAERPPRFAQVPRGAAPGQGARDDGDDDDEDGEETRDRVRAEQNRMERMRMEVQEQYARIRAAKRAKRA